MDAAGIGASAAPSNTGNVSRLNTTTLAAGTHPASPLTEVTTSHRLSAERPHTVSAAPVGRSPNCVPSGRSKSCAPPPRTTATTEPAPPIGAVAARPTGVSVGTGVGVSVGAGVGVGDAVGVGVAGGVEVGVGNRADGVAPAASDGAGTLPSTITGKSSMPNSTTSLTSTQPLTPASLYTTTHRLSSDRPTAVRTVPAGSSPVWSPPGVA